MPRIRRWFHVSHDINSDPEVWELTDACGERAYRVWMEVLSIADRYDGLVPGELKPLCSTIGAKNKVRSSTVKKVLEFATNKTWLVYDPVRRVRNHLKYRPTRGDKQIPPGEQTASPPLLHTPTLHTTKQKTTHITSPRSNSLSALNGFDEFWGRYPRKEGRGKAEESWRIHAKGVSTEEIIQGIEKWEHSEKWAEGIIPMPATWLNQKRWLDTPIVKSKTSQAQQLWDQSEREEGREE